MFLWLLERLRMDVPSETEEYYEDTDWRTFRIDESIWKHYTFQRPKIAYYRELQVCYVQLLQEMKDAYLYNVPELLEHFNEAHASRCSLEKELAVAQGRIEILTERLQSALEWQTANGLKNEVRTAAGLQPKAAAPAPERTASNKFVSRSGASKKENQMQAAALFENDWTIPEIAEALQIGEGAVKSYLSCVKKHYELKVIQGRRTLFFDQEYGNNEIDLAFYDRIENKQLEHVAV